MLNYRLGEEYKNKNYDNIFSTRISEILRNTNHLSNTIVNVSLEYASIIDFPLDRICYYRAGVTKWRPVDRFYLVSRKEKKSKNRLN